MRSRQELRAELACLERRRLMLIFARAGQILGDTRPITADPLVLLGELSAAGPLELIEREAEQVEIRSTVIRTWLADEGAAAAPGSAKPITPRA